MKAALDDECTITSRAVFRSGTYFALSIRKSNGGVVTVKARARPGPPYVCLTCLVNDCPHTRFVAAHDTPDEVDLAPLRSPLPTLDPVTP